MKKCLSLFVMIVIVTSTIITSAYGDSQKEIKTNESIEIDLIKLDKLMEKSKKFRAELGLDNDYTTIKGLIDNLPGKEVTVKYGSVMTDKEFIEITRRQKIIEEGKKIRRDLLQKKYADTFGGMYFDHLDSGGKLKIGIVDLPNNESVVNSLLSEFTNKDKLHFFNVKYTYNVLAKLLDKLNNFIEEKNYNISTEISLVDNNIHIFLTPDNKQVIQIIEEEFGSELLHFDVSEGNAMITQSRSAPYDPLWGGLKITNTITNLYCTSSYSAKDSNNNYYLISAGHCGEIGDIITQGGNTIGSVSKQLFSQLGVDALAISINSSDASASIYDNNVMNNNELIIEGWEKDEDDAMVGDLVCMSGVTTGEVSCGQILGKGGKVRYSVESAGGDSGAPVYTPNYLTGTAYIKGTHTGRYDDGDANFSHVADILQRLNLSSIIID